MVVDGHLFPGQAAKLTEPDAGQPEEQQDLAEQGVGVPQEGQELLLREGPLPALGVEVLALLERVERERIVLHTPTPAGLHGDDAVIDGPGR